MNEKKELKKLLIFDWKILVAIIFLMITGGVAVYSSTYNPDATKLNWLFLKYVFFSITGLIIMCITMFINYTKLAEHRISLYIPMLLVLITVLIPGVGTTINGSSSWLFGMQPSEFGKVIMIIFLAGYLDQIGDKIKEEKYFALAGFFIIIPIILVLLQPDLGTVLVYCFIVFVMLFVGGVPVRYIIGLLSIGVIGLSIPMFLAYKKMSDDINNILFNFLSHRLYIGYICGILLFISILLLTINFYMNNKIIDLLSFSFFVLFLSMCAALIFDVGLKTYQKERLLVFMNPELTRLSSGYNIIQSLIAFASGGFSGVGYGGSIQKLSYLPECHTDFIFAIIAEELGFVGCVLVIGLFFTFMQRGFLIAARCPDMYGKLLAVGITFSIVFQAFMNMSVASSFLPTTGVPLPFISYGGSSLIVSLIMVGILLNISKKRIKKIRNRY